MYLQNSFSVSEDTQQDYLLIAYVIPKFSKRSCWTIRTNANLNKHIKTFCAQWMKRFAWIELVATSANYQKESHQNYEQWNKFQSNNCCSSIYANAKKKPKNKKTIKTPNRAKKNTTPNILTCGIQLLTDEIILGKRSKRQKDCLRVLYIYTDAIFMNIYFTCSLIKFFELF